MSTRRRSSGSMSLGTVTQLATLKPNPPEMPRGSLLLDITNGSGGSEAEMQRLSTQALDLMAKMRLRDDEVKRLENVVSTLQKEVSNLTAQLAQVQRERNQPTSAPSSSSGPTRSMPCVPGATKLPPKTPPSPQKAQQAVMLKIMSRALTDADAQTALRTEELAAARAMLHHHKPSRGPSPQQPAGDAPPPGVVARLQADLSEAAEERRTLRQQLQSQREWGKEVQAQLAERASQLAETERARQALEKRLGASSAGADDQKKLLGELRAAQTAVNSAEARAEDLERRLQIAQARAHEQGLQLTQLRKELQAALSSRSGVADEMNALRAQLQAALDEAAALRRHAESESASAADATARAERAEADHARAAQDRASSEGEGRRAEERLRSMEGAMRELQARLEAAEAEAHAKSLAVEKVEAGARDAAKRSEARLNEARQQSSKLEQRLALAAESEAAAGRQAAEALKRAAALEAQLAELQAQLAAKESQNAALHNQLGSLRDEASKATTAARRAQGEVDELNARIAKLQAEMRAQQQVHADELRDSSKKADAAPKVDPDELRRAREDLKRAQEDLKREGAARREAEEKLREARDRLLKQQKAAEDAASQLRAKADEKSKAASSAPPPSALPPSGAAHDDSELRRLLKAAQDELQEVKDELAKKMEQWRLTALKRHAEMNKLEQALKVAQKNESLLKKKADMLELTLLSHQKSMDKGRANMVTAQLKEHNERLEQQTAIKDMHAQATQRATFQQTYDKQMNALDGKLRSLER